MSLQNQIELMARCLTLVKRDSVPLTGSVNRGWYQLKIDGDLTIYWNPKLAVLSLRIWKGKDVQVFRVDEQRVTWSQADGVDIDATNERLKKLMILEDLAGV